jgi:ELWxxDGT repeat protein
MQKSKSRSRARSNRKGGTFFGLERLESRELLALAPQLLKDIGFGDSSNPSGVIQVGDNRYFSADDGVHGQELWKTDGTPAGTTMVKDIRPGAANLDVRSMASFAGALYFTAGGAFEGDPMALRSAYRRWQTPTTYAARLTNLRYGAVPLMNSATIFNDFSGDALVGGDDDDWFVTVGFDSIVDAQEHEEGLGAPIGRRLRSN